MTRDKAAELRDTLKGELLLAWQSLNNSHPHDDFYAFGLFTTDNASYAGVVACSEQGLNTAADGYAERYGMNPELHRSSLRWSIGDSPFLEEGLELLPLTQALRASEPDPYSDADECKIEASIAQFFSAAFAALQELDEGGVFGTREEREKIILSVWLHDESHPMKLEAAGRLNSQAGVTRYSAELEAGLSAFHAWQEHRHSENPSA